MIIGEEVYLIQEIADVDTAQWVHLREGEHTRKSDMVLVYKFRWISEHSRWQLILLGAVPTDIDDFFVFVWIVDWHWHVIIC